MNPSRRTSLKVAGGAGLYPALLAIGLLKPGLASAAAFDRAAFESRGIVATLKALGAADAQASGEVEIISQDIAENGAVVSVGVRSKLPGVQALGLLVDRNPNALAAWYKLLDRALPEVTMRVKMSQTSEVVGLVKAGGRFYLARKEIIVTIGGCG
jgi:sulfur-oxidizing protein SoxY